MKVKKTITIENWLCQAILKKIPKARYNFSAAVEALLILGVNNPEAYWKSQIQHHQLKLSMAVEQVKNIQAVKNADKVIDSGVEIRKDLLV